VENVWYENSGKSLHCTNPPVEAEIRRKDALFPG